MLDDVQKYLAALPPDVRRILKRMREDIRAAAPAASEHFSYGIPGFKLDGKPLVWYAAFKSHISMFPMGPAIQRKYARELKGLKTAKGTIQFPLSKPPSSSLVKKLTKARVAEAGKP